MLKRIAAILLIVLSLSLQSCVSATAGLKGYIDSYDGYEFVYPNGWLPIQVPGGPDVVFHDLIEESENVSVVISPVPDGKTLADLGTPSEVGQRLAQSVITTPDAERRAELVNAEAKESDAGTYYMLEYVVKLPGQNRHNLASAVVRRGQLFTFNASTLEQRWPKVKDSFQQMVNSFQVY